jgi:hypothetical protein
MGFIDYEHRNGIGFVSVSALGRTFLLERRNTSLG